MTHVLDTILTSKKCQGTPRNQGPPTPVCDKALSWTILVGHMMNLGTPLPPHLLIPEGY